MPVILIVGSYLGTISQTLSAYENLKTNKIDIINIIIPPILGYSTYFVPERKETKGIEIILINRLGIRILRIKLPSENSLPKMDNMLWEKIKTNKHIKADRRIITELVLLNIWEILLLSPSPNNFENSGRNTWVNNLGKNIKILTMVKTEE